MSDPAVIDWDRIIHKNVRSKDMEGAGNVVAIDGDSVIISTQGGQHQYKIPKSHVEGYNGAEVFLDLSVSDISSFNTDNNKSQAISKQEVLANERKQASVKIPIPSITTKPMTTRETISSSTQNYNNNKLEKTQQAAITRTAGLPVQPVSNDNNIIQKEQGLRKKEETISSIREEGPVKSEVTVRPTQSITTPANKTSSISSKPTPEIQNKNNIPTAPQSSSLLTTKTLAEPPEKMIGEEEAVEKAVTKVETETSSSMTNNSTIQQQNQQKIENEVPPPPTSSTIQKQENIQPEVEVTIKPPNNIEFNPPISAENVSTAIEAGIDGSSAVEDIRVSKEQQDPQPQQSLNEGKIGQNNKHLPDNLTSFTTGFALWQHSVIYWIDMYNEFATDAAKLTEYWFNAFVNPSTEREEKMAKKNKKNNV
jgi:hypothetical protein